MKEIDVKLAGPYVTHCNCACENTAHTDITIHHNKHQSSTFSLCQEHLAILMDKLHDRGERK